MKFDISFERVYLHPPEKVWRALIDPTALGEWLMETDFEPKVGRNFRMWCEDGAGGTDTYHCVLLEYDPPNRMLWSWLLAGRQDAGETFVEFRIEPVAGGTKVTINHTGDRDAETIESFKGGWPYKLDLLSTVLSVLSR
ncbi:MAG: hypothetical protein GKS00_24875 [Alphaproteobacteria bacterium]|nr:hypothetical protein [Alphaproteobacteria bacterium]